MKKINFKVLIRNIDTKEIQLKEVTGYQIDNNTAIYLDYPYWFVTDLESGRYICCASTKKDAINKYQNEETKKRIINAKRSKVYITLKKEFTKRIKNEI